jgi:hypothetical protein
MRALILTALIATSAFAQKVEVIASPAGDGSMQASLSVNNDGAPLLSWVQNGSLMYSVWKANAWAPAQVIAASRKFFHHPAELPEVIIMPGGSLLAHWVEMPDPAKEAENLYVSTSTDGIKWTTPVMAHKDHSPVQHGLASVVASGPKEASIIWLQALKGEDGPVSLMRSVVSNTGALIKEESLDQDVCSCCPTSVVKTAKGLLIAYRDHTTKDVRDIATIRFENGKWSPSKIISADNWQIDACPINAASASAKADNVAVGWYTAAGEKPRVQIALSKDDGATFSKPTLVSTGAAYGYTSVQADDEGGAYISWLERGNGAGRILLRHIDATGAAGPVTEIAKGDRQGLGYPRLLRTGKDLWMAWGNSDADTKVQVARITQQAR